jgi:histidine kinase
MSQGNYKFSKVSFDTDNSLYYDAADDNGAPVLIRVSKQPYPTLEEMVGLKNDFEITDTLKTDGILANKELIRHQSGIAIVKEYFDGLTLSTFIEAGQMSIERFLSIASAVTGIVQQLHEQKIIHRDINPSNILVSQDGTKAKLLNFNIATPFTNGQQEMKLSNAMNTSLTHISPEQTGRMNRSVDYRTDLYSLGITFYQMLCNKLPFEYKDIMELIHAHIARYPAEPHAVDERIPKVLSDMVMKLMAKNAEDRYQSAAGLKADLDECSRQWKEKKHIDGMKIAFKDNSPVLCISEKLYGRTEEMKTLIDAFERCRDNSVEMILVAGYSGIGKTRLINEIHKPIASRNGYFTSGKFDQYNRDTPYSALGQALSSLIQQFLGENNDNIRRWKEHILTALDGNGEVLANVIPDLEMLIGKQQPVIKLGPLETKVRFLTTFEHFLKALGSGDHPLVIFIDDLQWADSGSFELLHHIITGARINNVVLIGAYRDNEVNETHPLSTLLDRIKETASNKVSTIVLKELAKDQVNQLIADTLRQGTGDTAELTELVMNKTRGNPFFIRQFLQQLAIDNAITFSADTNNWTWDFVKIGKMNVTDNVVDLLVNKLKKLSPGAQELLRLASCVGNRFDIETLSIVSEKDENETAVVLWEAVQEGFINPLGRWNKHAKDQLWKELGLVEKNADFNFFKFQHDKIQQAAYSLIPEQEKKPTNLKIGRLLLQKLSEKEIQEHLFDILALLNFSADLISSDAEKVSVAKLNFRAGEKAKNANAYEPARNCFIAGMNLLENNKSLELYRDFLIARSECEYLCGNFELSEQMYDIAYDNAIDKLQKATVCASKMQLYENTQRHAKAIEVAKLGLELLGTDLPLQPTQEEIGAEMAEVKALLKNKKIAQLLNNEKQPSPEIILTQKLLMNLFGPVYLLANVNLLIFYSLRMVKLSMQHGNSSESAQGFALYGYISCAVFGEYKSGYEFSRLGIALNRKFNDKTLVSKVMVMAEGCAAPWGDRYSNTIENLRTAFDAGVETNDLVWAGYSATWINRHLLFMGENLDSVYDKVKGYIHFAKQIQSPVSLHQLLAISRLTISLKGIEADPELYGEYADIGKQLEFLTDFAFNGSVYLPLANFYIFNGAQHYYLKEYDRAYENLDRALPILAAVGGLSESGEHNFYHSLSMIAMLKQGAENKDELLGKIQANQAALANWVKHSPDNFKGKYLLVQAELAGYKRQLAKAADLFAEAINVASKSGLIHISALVFERAADFYTKKKFTDLASLLYRDAWIAYREWGAIHKAKQLEGEHSYLTQLVGLRSVAGGIHVENSSSSMDLQTIFKASTTISGEVVFEKLLEKLLKIVVENAGAQNGFIILSRGEKLFVEAIARFENNWEYQNVGQPLDSVSGLAHSIVQLAYHTSETLIINDANKDMRFDKDEHVKRMKPKSVLCMPVLQYGKCLAILYLENNLASGAFTPDRLEILNLLSGQIAISLQNAELYENLEQKVSERTQTIELQKMELEKEKEKSDSLLLNILPYETAEELKRTGTYKPRKYDNVTIMFTDFVDFTKLSEKLTVEELVDLIDYCYKKFDTITTKHNVEKIKTIGDAYMCVSGLPVANDTHAINAINAALEMVTFINELGEQRKQQNLPFCLIRVGIHSGPVATGVVGSKKFAYDVWGDSVNIAVRLESASEPGKINISTSTYELINNDFNCSHRGKISVKNKGEIDMYFVEPN